MKTESHIKKSVDVKNLHLLVPEKWLPRINLLFNKDVPKVPNTAAELIIYNIAGKKETYYQQHFHEEFNAMAAELKMLHKDNELEFVQNDNGDTAGGQLSQIQRMVLYKRKKAEGSKHGFSDISMYFYNAKTDQNGVILCETKKIGAPSEIHLREDQLEWFLKMNKMGFKTYITNNPIFFRDVVLGEVKKMFK